MALSSGSWKPGESGNKKRGKKPIWKDEIEKAILKMGDKNHTSPFLRVAKLFYRDDAACIGILGFLTPKLKAIDAKIEAVSPYRLIIDCTPVLADKKPLEIEGKDAEKPVISLLSPVKEVILEDFEDVEDV